MAVNDSFLIQDAISKAVEAEIAKRAQAELDAMRSRLESAVQAAVGEIAASVLKNYSMERRGDDLVIRVRIGGNHG